MLKQLSLEVFGTAESHPSPEPARTPRETPFWDPDLRELYVAGRLVKRFTRPIPVLELILQAFEEASWPRALRSPLPLGRNAKRLLHDAIKRLNLCQKERAIQFGGDGTGLGIRWQLVAAWCARFRNKPESESAFGKTH